MKSGFGLFQLEGELSFFAKRLKSPGFSQKLPLTRPTQITYKILDKSVTHSLSPSSKREKRREAKLKKLLVACLAVFLILTMTPSAMAAQHSKEPAISTQFELVSEETLTELEKVFVEVAKKTEGVHQYGSLYVVALGAQPNPGYGLKLEKEIQTLEQLKIFIKRTTPEKNVVYPQVVTYPCLVGRLYLPTYTTLSVMDTASNKPLFDKQKQLLDFRDKQFTTDSRKEWTISLKEKESSKNDQVYIQKLGETKKTHPIKLKIKKKAIHVKPLEKYLQDATYLLHIKHKITGKHTIIPFEVKSQLKTVELDYNFNKSLHGWVGDFSDLPINYSQKDYKLSFGHELIPIKERLKKGLLLSGMNRSDDLFMYAKKRIGKEEGLLPNQTYLLKMEVDFYTNADPGLVGVGGAPGESVYMKAGVSAVEPKVIPINNDWRMNVDKGEQAASGKNAVVIGHIAKEKATGEQYALKKLRLSEPLLVKTNKYGELWVFFGTDSGFEGMTSLYYDQVKISLEKQNKK